jgi:hypothetical protein
MKWMYLISISLFFAIGQAMLIDGNKYGFSLLVGGVIMCCHYVAYLVKENER